MLSTKHSQQFSSFIQRNTGGDHYVWFGPRHPQTRRPWFQCVMAQRIAYEMKHGELPKHPRTFVWAACGQEECMNPEHMKCGTRAEMFKEGAGAGALTTARGEQAGASKLTEEYVRYIRRAFNGGRFTKSQLARAAKVTPKSIADIVNGKTWKHLL